MAKIVQCASNFSKGKIDHAMMGRFDLPIYTTGADVFQNFISNYEGNAIYSSGFISRVLFQDCAFIEFKFGNTQNYLCVFYAGNVRFLAYDTSGNFGWVLSGGTPLTITSPYTLAEAKQISISGSYSQNADTMLIAHRNHAPMKLTRTAANAFTLATYTRTADPFYDPVSDTSATSNTVTTGSKTFTVSAAKGYTVGAPITITSGANILNGNVTSYATTSLVVNITSVVGTGTFTSWVIAQSSNYPGAVLYYKGRSYFASSLIAPTKIWYSNIGLYDDFTIQSPLTDASGFNFGVVDIAQRIEWLFPGDNSLIAGATDGIIAINGGAVNTAITAATVQANITTAEPTNGSYPIKKDGLIFYIGRNNRNVYYFKYDILSESFLSKDANIISYDITKGGLTKIRAKKDRNDLIFNLRGDGALTSLTFNEAENINGWHERTTDGTFTELGQIADNLGNPQVFTLAIRNGSYYIEQQAPYVEFAQRVQFFTGADIDSQADDDEAYTRKMADQLRDCIYLDNSLTYSDLRTSTITFTPTTFDADGNPTAGTIVSGAADFLNTDAGKHIVYKTSTGYESGRFEIETYTNANTVGVNVLQNPKTAAQAPLYVWSSWYKSFNQISGLTQYNGQEIGIVTDGGFLDNFTISGGVANFDGQTTSVVVGYGYTGTLKTFCLGFQLQGNNTQTTLKNIVRVGLRTLASAGGEFGADPYNLQPFQELGQNDLNYLPPVPVDGTEYRDYTDDADEDKFLYVIQDQPLPFQLCGVLLEANYATQS